nr:MAG TPA: hypothetical protein [Caudoviricetes sp.]
MPLAISFSLIRSGFYLAFLFQLLLTSSALPFSLAVIILYYIARIYSMGKVTKYIAIILYTIYIAFIYIIWYNNVQKGGRHGRKIYRSTKKGIY